MTDNASLLPVSSKAKGHAPERRTTEHDLTARATSLPEVLDVLELACDDHSDLQLTQIASGPYRSDRLVLREALLDARAGAVGALGGDLGRRDLRYLENVVEHLAEAGYVLVRTLLGVPPAASNEMGYDAILHGVEANDWPEVLPERIMTIGALLATSCGGRRPSGVEETECHYSAAFATGVAWAVCEFQERGAADPRAEHLTAACRSIAW